MENGEQLRVVLCDEETKRDLMPESNGTAKEEGAQMSDGEQKMEAHKSDDLETTVHHEELKKGEEAAFKPAETISPEEELWAQPQSQLAEHRNLEATWPMVEQPHMSTEEESVTPARAAVAEMECWDENLFADSAEMQAEPCGPGLDLVTLLAEAQSPPNESWTQPSQAGWHIPAGPGLTELVHCPTWQFPTMSYYPSLQQTTPLEGEK